MEQLNPVVPISEVLRDLRNIDDAYDNGGRSYLQNAIARLQEKEMAYSEYSERRIIETVCHLFNVSEAEIKLRYANGKLRKKRSIVEARQMIMYLIMKKWKRTSSYAGSIFGQDHCTALHARNTIDGLLRTNKPFRERMKFIIEWANLSF